MEKTAGADDIRGGTSLTLSYVLITPAWNEAQFVEGTILSVASQDLKPLRWVIVSDGSTDGTDDIVKRYMAAFPWLELVRMPERKERHFAGKVNAFNAGYARVQDLDFDVVGCVDADVSFQTDHFSFIMSKFLEDEKLGVAGTAYIENGELAYNYDVTNIQDVSGACQIFRRKCFEDIGGYVPIRYGGIDLAAVYTARMKGWKTQTFTDRTFIHHRRRGTGQSKYIYTFFRYGKQDYCLGGHPLWEILRSIYHMNKKPYIASGIMVLAGYCWAGLCRTERPVSAEFVAFRRNEQMQRLRTMARKLFGLSSHK